MEYSLYSGIFSPIEAKQRKGKGAVGAYGSERTKQSLQDFPAVDSEEEEEKVRNVLLILLSVAGVIIVIRRCLSSYFYPGISERVESMEKGPGRRQEEAQVCL